LGTGPVKSHFARAVRETTETSPRVSVAEVSICDEISLGARVGYASADRITPPGEALLNGIPLAPDQRAYHAPSS
jgi:hypothetical protein